jgi:hypothetical protein
MKKSAFLSVSLVAIALSGWLSTARADSAEATCQVRKDGEVKQGRSGPCTFSQRQGYIDLDLRNGVTYSLAPGNNANHYKYQKGNKVIRTQAGGNTQEFKWEGGTKVTVTFVGATAGGGGGNAAVGSGETPADLKDLVNGRLVGGEVDDEMTRRGYRQAKSEVQGDEVYSYWRKPSNGQCVVVHYSASRHVSSIAHAFESSCK